MAIPGSQLFDNEVTLTREPDGGFAGTAASREALGGGVPGLAGSRPRVRVEGETVRVESDPAEQPEPAWTAWLVAWSNRLHNRWVNRRHGKAEVRAFELVVPGIAARVQPGATLRLRHQLNAGPGIATGLRTEVTLTEGQGVVATWTPGAPVRSPW